MFDDKPDENFPTSSNKDEIKVCLDNLKNKVELKEHLDREMTLLYLTTKEERGHNEEEREIRLMQNIYESCYAGYRNYMMDEKVTKELAVNCSKYLFFRKS